MIRTFLTINSQEDVSNAIALFNNHDIKNADFNGVTFFVIPHSKRNGTFECDYSVQIRTGGKNLVTAYIDNSAYKAIVRDVVYEILAKYAERTLQEQA